MHQPAPKQVPSAASAENPAQTSGRSLEPHDLEAALQLLVDRAQYITGATGAALALSLGTEMVCRASAGSCAPPVGARLQVRSGLTGESVSRKQLLRCDNAENDPRVNLETCRELGIASIVVLPLLSAKGEVRGLFELFSDHAYAFEERDLIALERMAELTRTALDLAEKASVVVPPRSPELKERAMAEQQVAMETPLADFASGSEIEASVNELELSPIPHRSSRVAQFGSPTELSATQAPPRSQPRSSLPQSSCVPEAMRRVQKCSSCGFPVSEGRSLCLDCEEKQHRQPGVTETIPAEFVPSFGVSSSDAPADDSWLANHVNLLALLVLILSIVVAVVVFK